MYSLENILYIDQELIGWAFAEELTELLANIWEEIAKILMHLIIYHLD